MTSCVKQFMNIEMENQLLFAVTSSKYYFVLITALSYDQKLPNENASQWCDESMLSCYMHFNPRFD